MKELDFDELDRAVTSLMGGVQKGTMSKTSSDDTTVLEVPTTDTSFAAAVRTQAPSTVPVQPTQPTAPTPTSPALETSSAAQAAAPAPVVEQEPVAAVPTATPLATRRGGRFMDVVHPSSDMKTATMAPSRQGVTIQPMTTSASASPVTSVSTAPVVQDVTETEVPSGAPLESATTQDSEWPDPLGGFGVEPATDATNSTQSDATDEIAGTDSAQTDSAIDSDDVAPLTTPFLADAKVDKRPLGGTGDSAAAAAPVDVSAATVDEEPVEELGRAPVLGALVDEAISQHDPDDQLPPKIDTPTEASLPEELQGDLVAIESGAATGRNEAPVAPESPLDSPSPKPAKASVVDSSLASTGPASIQPQYKEEASTGDQTNGSIFDTRGYHQPLAHPEKKKSGWLWVVWVVIILILGAGSGAALYFFNVI